MPTADADGVDLRPDPRAVTSAAEMAAALRAYRIWSGEPSYRTLGAMVGQVVAASTLCTALSEGRLPRLAVATAVTAACGGSEQEQRRWATARRRIRLGAGMTG
jgi:hypothetical protein